jgi:hypothetical protein
VISIQNLEPGTRLTLHSGARVVVVDNPRDGAWLMVRPASAPDTVIPEPCSVDDVASVDA